MQQAKQQATLTTSKRDYLQLTTKVRAEGGKAVDFALGVLVDCLFVPFVGGSLQYGPAISWYVTDVWALHLRRQQCHDALQFSQASSAALLS